MHCFSIILLLLLPLHVLGQEQFVSLLPTDSGWETSQNQAELTLNFQIEAPYHIMADQAQIADPYLLATELTIENLEEYSIEFPEAHTISLGQEPVYVFDGLFRIRIQTDPGKLPQTHSLTGKLTYQTCDDRKCFFPRELSFELDLSRYKTN